MLKCEYKAAAKDIIVAVGPGICKSCYEVSSDVAEQFRENFTANEFELIIAKGKTDDKYQLDLPMANVINLINFGVPIDNIYVSDLCTCCNPKLLFSHRATAGRRGILCNFINITPM